MTAGMLAEGQWLLGRATPTHPRAAGGGGREADAKLHSSMLADQRGDAAGSRCSS